MTTSGVVCLQGGGEFSPRCQEMDAQVLAAVPGPVAVVALAAAPGREYERAHLNGTRYFRSLGAEVVDVPDPRTAGTRAELGAARVVVLPGGSPSRLLEALRATGWADLLAELVADGGAVIGASAGAMVLGEWTVLPEEGPRLAPGLGVVPGVVVVPHWRGPREDWLAVIGRGTVLGIPEESGVLVHAGQLTAVGQRPTRLVREGADLSVGATVALK